MINSSNRRLIVVISFWDLLLFIMGSIIYEPNDTGFVEPRGFPAPRGFYKGVSQPLMRRISG